MLSNMMADSMAYLVADLSPQPKPPLRRRQIQRGRKDSGSLDRSKSWRCWRCLCFWFKNWVWCFLRSWEICKKMAGMFGQALQRWIDSVFCTVSSNQKIQWICNLAVLFQFLLYVVQYFTEKIELFIRKHALKQLNEFNSIRKISSQVEVIDNKWADSLWLSDFLLSISPKLLFGEIWVKFQSYLHVNEFQQAPVTCANLNFFYFGSAILSTVLWLDRCRWNNTVVENLSSRLLCWKHSYWS